jgi:hypothetical protein
MIPPPPYTSRKGVDHNEKFFANVNITENSYVLRLNLSTITQNFSARSDEKFYVDVGQKRLPNRKIGDP